MADGAPQVPTPEQASAARIFSGRERLARWVVVGSFLTIFMLVFALLLLAKQNAGSDASKAAENAFNAILPVLAGWVGTVLAFYFSAASQERTSNSLDSVIQRTGQGTAGPGRPLAEKMLPLASILEVQDLTKTKPEEIKLATLKKLVDPTAAKPITRIMFVENGVFRYIVHVGTLDGFLLKRTTGEGARSIDELTFADMLLDPETLRVISKLVVFVSAAATLGEAKTALDSVAGAQDVIVTATGNASAPMLGWISNVDLTKALNAN
jgi:hypothetical protein